MNGRKMVVPDKKKERDPDFVNAEIALQRAARKARQRALQAGIGVIVFQDGRIIEDRPSERTMKIQTIAIAINND